MILTDTHTFNGLFSRTTWVRQHQKGKPFWILLKQDMMEWQWHQLDHMQIICTTFQTDNHASIPSLNFFYGLDALPDAQATVSKHICYSLKSGLRPADLASSSPVDATAFSGCCFFKHSDTEKSLAARSGVNPDIIVKDCIADACTQINFLAIYISWSQVANKFL